MKELEKKNRAIIPEISNFFFLASSLAKNEHIIRINIQLVGDTMNDNILEAIKNMKMSGQVFCFFFLAAGNNMLFKISRYPGEFG